LSIFRKSVEKIPVSHEHQYTFFYHMSLSSSYIEIYCG